MRRILKAFNADENYIDTIVNELEELGVEAIIEEGELLLHTGVRVLGKGQNSVVVKCLYKGETCACKILRPDASRRDLIHEAHMLQIANKVNVGPRIYSYRAHIIVMQLIRGVKIEKYVQETSNKFKIKKIVIDLIEQAYNLDEIGLEHDELSRPEEHVLIENDVPYIIDFESAKYRGRRTYRNLTQILNALLVGRSKVAFKIRNMLNINDVTSIIQLLREYKKNSSREIVNKIVSYIDTV
ncbi:MAG: serine/threonine protein kinase [Crenarchaeota archaeon]|nr:serine/threonine protein kinase [Thermoproteota archaeon]